MAEDANEGRYILLWWGDGAVEWEIDFWQKIKQAEGFAGAGAAEALLEVFTHDEWHEKHDQLIADGWRYTSSGSGSLRRVSLFSRK